MQLKSTFAILILIGSLILTMSYQNVIMKELFKSVTIVAGLFLAGTLDDTTHQEEQTKRKSREKENSL